MTSQITALENIVQSLNSYSLPEQYANNANNNNNINNNNNNTNSIKNEYKNAREIFLRNRIQSQLKQYMTTYNENGTNNNFNIPPEKVPSSDKNMNDIESEELINTIHRSSSIATEKIQLLLSTSEVIHERREELCKVLQDAKVKVERHQQQNDDDDDAMEDDVSHDDNGDDDDDKEFMTLHHNEEFTKMIHQRLELEAKLKRIENDIEQTKAETFDKKQNFKEMMNVKNLDCLQSNKDNDILLNILNNNDADSSPRSLEEYEKSIQSVREVDIELEGVTKQNNTMTNFYDQLISFTSKSSGVHLLYIQEPQPMEEEHSNSNTTTPSKKKKEENLILHFQLFEKYDLEITLTTNQIRETPSSKRRLSSNKSTTDSGIMDSLIISNAEITNTNEIIDNVHGTISCPIEINELIMLSRHLSDKTEQTRFLVLELCSRIQSTELRINDLAQLRTKYLTKVVSDQADEVICTLNEGLTIILHVLLHCPVVTVFIHEILGVGGWDSNVLEDIKNIVNSKKYSGSIAVMDAVVKEVEKVDSRMKARNSPCNFRINKKPNML